MLCIEKGVLPSSRVYFYTAGHAARAMFLTVLCTGRYDCDSAYRVERRRYDSLLVLHVLSGSGYARIAGRMQPLHAGDFVLLDCYTPHLYGTDEGFSILWVHFSGPAAREMFASLSPDQTVLRACDEGTRLRAKLEMLFALFDRNRQITDAHVHRLLTDLLTAFFMPRGNSETPSQCMDRVAAYLSEHMGENVSINTLAQLAHVSPSHLIRIFRREKGVSPHRYLMDLRLSAAKYLLCSTTLSLSQVAEQCGFTDASSLVHTFRHVTGLTPRAYALSQRAESVPPEA